MACITPTTRAVWMLPRLLLMRKSGKLGRTRSGISYHSPIKRVCKPSLRNPETDGPLLVKSLMQKSLKATIGARLQRLLTPRSIECTDLITSIRRSMKSEFAVPVRMATQSDTTIRCTGTNWHRLYTMTSCIQAKHLSALKLWPHLNLTALTLKYPGYKSAPPCMCSTLINKSTKSNVLITRHGRRMIYFTWLVSLAMSM